MILKYSDDSNFGLHQIYSEWYILMILYDSICFDRFWPASQIFMFSLWLCTMAPKAPWVILISFNLKVMGNKGHARSHTYAYILWIRGIWYNTLIHIRSKYTHTHILSHFYMYTHYDIVCMHEFWKKETEHANRKTDHMSHVLTWPCPWAEDRNQDRPLHGVANWRSQPIRAKGWHNMTQDEPTVYCDHVQMWDDTTIHIIHEHSMKWYCSFAQFRMPLLVYLAHASRRCKLWLGEF